MISNMTTEAAKFICSWQYPPPYNIYNYMSYDEAIKNKSPLLNVENADSYICFWEAEILVAYMSIYKKADRVFMGIGLAPEFCSKGLGKAYIKQGLEVIRKQYSDCDIWVQVRSWNERAIKCYESCGFKEKYSEVIKDRFGNDTEFVYMCMEN